jgi:thiol-disulfide isomerase/thioredoxin
MITDGYRFRVFFGSWCGDSKREVPRFLKLLDLLGVQGESRELIGVGNKDTVYKRSPAGEEEGLGIFRVPTFIILKNGKEINRITEFPVRSLERDLFSIVNEEGYSPNYKTYPYVLRWLEEGLLTDRNVSERGLANQIRSLVMNRWELELAGFVFLRRGDPTAALTIFRMNRYLFPDDPRSYASLAEGLDAAGDREAALIMVDRALGLSTDPDQQERFRELKDRIER